MRARTGARRARGATTLAVAAAIAAAAVVPVLGLEAADTLANSTTGEVVAGPSVQALPFTPAAMLATVEDGAVVGITLLAMSPSGAGGTAVVVPVGAALQDAAGTRTRVGDAYATGGIEGLTAAVESLTGVTISAAQDVDAAGLTAMLEPYGPFEVDLPDPVVGSGPDGAPVIVREAGPQQLTAAEVADALTTVRPSETEVVRLPDIEALWEGIVAADGRTPDPVTPPTTAPAEVASYLDGLLAGTAQMRSLTVRPLLDPVTNPSGIDLLATDNVEIVLLMSRILPSAVSPAGTGLRIRVIDSTGDPRAAHELAQRLLFVGLNLVWLETGQTQDETTAAFSSEDVRTRTGDLAGLVGPVRYQTGPLLTDGIDIEIELGRDFVDAVGEEALESGFSTTTAGDTTTTASVPAGSTPTSGGTG